MKSHFKWGALMILFAASTFVFSGCGLLWFGAGAATVAAVDDDEKIVVVEKDSK